MSFIKFAENLPATLHLTTLAIDQAGQKWQIIAYQFIGKIEMVFDRIQYNLNVQRKEGLILVGHVSLGFNKENQALTVQDLENRTCRWNPEKPAYKRIGSAGIEVAFRISCALGMEGRIHLFPVDDSPFFYYTLGLRFYDKSKDLSDLEEIKTPIQAWVKGPLNEKALTEEEILLFDKDQLLAFLIQENLTTRWGIRTPTFLQAKMYLPEVSIQERKRIYQML